MITKPFAGTYEATKKDGSHHCISRRRLLGSGMVICTGVLTGCSASGDPRKSTEGLVAWPADNLWPNEVIEAPAEIRDAYRYAVANEDVLQWMPCFCGCVTGGHRHNFDCYVREVRGDGSVALDAMSFG